MPGQQFFRASIALCLLVLYTSCAELENAQQAATEAARKAAAALQPSSGYWHDEPVSGSAKIVVNLTQQRAFFYIGKHLIGESTVSTGKHGFSTPPGSYRVLWKDKNHISTVFGSYVDEFGSVVKPNVDSRKDSKPAGSHFEGASMPFAMFFRGGYAMHQGYVPPYAASHGCIRLPHDMAERFFDATPVGTSVLVKE
jgi:lipoprotein-anchoring transpeptidase ErfK/SrfK